jgi:ABC-type nitrate/sulfonate/bicarbonate transport system substrate-binding protein
MNRILTLALVVASVLAAACTAAPPTAPNLASTARSSASPAKSGTMRLEVPDEADIADIPWLMAIDWLKEQGYDIETISLSNTLGPVAMAQGDIDMASLSNQLAWAAIGRGAAIRTVMDKSANTYMLITRKNVQTCADLDGRPVAVGSVSTVNWAMLNAYLQKECPETQPEILVVTGGSNRMAALLSDEVDGAMQDIDDLIELERERPGEFHALIVLAQEFPGLQLNSHAANRDFAEQHPEMVKDVIRAVFAARRTIQDANVLRDAITRYVGFEPDRAQQAADTYLARKVWDISGTYTPETVQAIIDFLQEFGDMPPQLKAADVANLSYYNAVLDEIGRQ